MAVIKSGFREKKKHEGSTYLNHGLILQNEFLSEWFHNWRNKSTFHLWFRYISGVFYLAYLMIYFITIFILESFYYKTKTFEKLIFLSFAFPSLFLSLSIPFHSIPFHSIPLHSTPLIRHHDSLWAGSVPSNGHTMSLFSNQKQYKGKSV